MTTVEPAETPFAPAPRGYVPPPPPDDAKPIRLLITIENTPATDGRIFHNLTARRPPLALAGQAVVAEGHDGAVVWGRIDELWRSHGPDVISRQTGEPLPEDVYVWEGRGWVDPHSEMYRLVKAGYLTGVSVDLAGADLELNESAAAGEPWAVIHSATIVMATVVPTPAFGDAYIELDGELVTPAADLLPMVASAGYPAWPSGTVAALGDPCPPCMVGLTAAAADDAGTGAMVALVPAAADATRLAIDGGLPVDDLHLTLAYLGDGADWTAEQRTLVADAAAALAAAEGPVAAATWAVMDINPGTDAACVALAVGNEEGPGSRIVGMRDVVLGVLGGTGLPPLPEQHRPFVPHLTLGYRDELGDGPVDTAERIGPVVLDRLRVSFGGDTTDYPLTGGAATADGLEPAEAVAAAGSWRPPAEWFRDPQLSEYTPLTITADGRVFGHVAVWGTCHVGIAARCVPPPRSRTGYSRFHLSAIVCDDGSTVYTGPLVLDTNHAALTASYDAAVDHYAHTGAAWADVVVGEDAIGIWQAGAVRPTATEDMIETARRSRQSGDWRPVGGGHELMAVLSVNMPGYPVSRGLVADGELQALVAAGTPAVGAARPVDWGPAHRALLAGLTRDYGPTHRALLAGLRGTVRAARHDIWDWLRHGEGAVRIRWGTPGDFTRCQRMLADEPGVGADKANRLCAEAHHDVTGMWPGDRRNR